MEMTREAAGVLVQRIMDADYADDDEVNGWLDELGRALACPRDYICNLIFWPQGPGASAAEAVDRALAYQPFAL
ncbi:e9imm peptide [Streptacidiphilus sp. EB129]|uniref:e9imm peptide n=1 Tax=Streptacidiphilus sp. EB129 TaxID=3156262 RepID=UPI003516F7A2